MCVCIYIIFTTPALLQFFFKDYDLLFYFVVVSFFSFHPHVINTEMASTLTRRLMAPSNGGLFLG
jgi:hypothetical protein